MNPTHIHMLLNHFPVIGTLIGSCLLLWGIIKNQQQSKNAAAVILSLMAIIAVPVFLTGEPAEESVEHLPGVMESMIEAHEEAAEIAIWIMGATGIAALFSLFMNRQKSKLANTGFTLTLVLAIICFAAMARTGYYGGQIRHTELSSNTAPAGGNEKEQTKDGEKDDD